MNKHSRKLASNPAHRLVHQFACLAGIAGLMFSGLALAEQATNAETAANTDALAYVDSVHEWGAWGLDLEPAAGGVQAPGTQPLRARDTLLQPRTNSFAALSPTRPTSVTSGPAPTPLTPTRPRTPAPVTPSSVPTMTPIGPGVPVPVGGPSDGF